MEHEFNTALRGRYRDCGKQFICSAFHHTLSSRVYHLGEGRRLLATMRHYFPLSPFLVGRASNAFQIHTHTPVSLSIPLLDPGKHSISIHPSGGARNTLQNHKRFHPPSFNEPFNESGPFSFSTHNIRPWLPREGSKNSFHIHIHIHTCTPSSPRGRIL